MDLTEDKDVLEHLLRLEAEASALVGDAQAEADKRISEGERVDRSRHDEAYAEKAASLEAAYIQKTSAMREDYQKQLDDYRNELNAQPVNEAAFSALAGKLLLSGKLMGGN